MILCGLAVIRGGFYAESLRQVAACSNEANAARRMLRLALVLEGYTRGEAARLCGMDRQTLRDWVIRYYGAKSTTDDYRILDVWRWAREGMLKAGYWGSWQWTRDGETVASIQMQAAQDRVILIYRHRSGSVEWKDEQYPVRIVRTPCNIGGERPWFICPAGGCGRRVAILYGGAASSPVGTATSSPTQARARMCATAHQGALTGSEPA